MVSISLSAIGAVLILFPGTLLAQQYSHRWPAGSTNNKTANPQPSSQQEQSSWQWRSTINDSQQLSPPEKSQQISLFKKLQQSSPPEKSHWGSPPEKSQWGSMNKSSQSSQEAGPHWSPPSNQTWPSQSSVNPNQEKQVQWGPMADHNSTFQPIGGKMQLSANAPVEFCRISTDVITKAAIVISGSGPLRMNITGSVEITQVNGVGPITISGTISGIAPGDHALHFHQFGNLNDGCDGGGPKFNRVNLTANRGNPSEPQHATGDLGNVQADNKGSATFTITNEDLSLNGDNSVMGRLLVIQDQPEDDGKAEEEPSNDYWDKPPTLKQPVQAIACGVVGVVAEKVNTAAANPPVNPTPAFNHQTLPNTEEPWNNPIMPAHQPSLPVSETSSPVSEAPASFEETVTATQMSKEKQYEAAFSGAATAKPIFSAIFCLMVFAWNWLA